MLCPYCLTEQNKFNFDKPQGKALPIYTCTNKECGSEVPALYVNEYSVYPPLVVSAVGFRAHGKSTYFASLFHVFKGKKLTHVWDKFFIQPVNEEALDTINENVRMLEQGKMPQPNPKNFPLPTMVQLHGIPKHQNRTLLCYDTSGESFERPKQLVQYARFVEHAETVFFLICLDKIEEPHEKLGELLTTYRIGMHELGAKTKSQHLVVVFTKADAMSKYFTGEWAGLRQKLVQGSLESMKSLDLYLEEVNAVSDRLRLFTEQQLAAKQFLSNAKENFRSVRFTMISALGGSPDPRTNQVYTLEPRRLLDPLLLAMHPPKRFGIF